MPPAAVSKNFCLVSFMLQVFVLLAVTGHQSTQWMVMMLPPAVKITKLFQK